MPPELSHLFLSSFVSEKDQLDWKAFSKAMLNASKNGVCAVDDRGTVILSNQVIQKIFGLFPGAMLASTLPECWHFVEATLKDHQYRSEIPVYHNDASFLARISPIFWKDSPIGVLCIFDDRTELEKITHKMNSFQRLSSELDSIIKFSSDGLWICDENATVVRINPASERNNHIQADEVIGRNMKDLVAEGYIDRSVTLEVLKRRKTIHLLQHTRNGRKLMLTGNPVFDDNGRLVRVVVTERDITEIDSLRRELEEQEAIQDRFKMQILEMQLKELESRNIIAHSPCFIKTLQKAVKVSSVDTTVLILGESGVGKGLIADMIHKYSNRSKHPMIKINCGAIPETLVESELFGYEKGAFTGAKPGGKPGYVELANNGILFLDEIAELPLSSQVKLLRFLEDGQVARVGGSAARKVNVRILAATNKDLETMVAEGKFRLDLFYRLNVIPLRIPPLRERKECILPMIQHFTQQVTKKLGIKKDIRFTQKATDRLLAYTYPGNVRELMNLCEQIVIMYEGERVDVGDLPSNLIAADKIDTTPQEYFSNPMSLQMILEAAEKSALIHAVNKYGTQEKAAAALCVNQSTIARKMKKYGLKLK